MGVSEDITLTYSLGIISALKIRFPGLQPYTFQQRRD